MVQGLSGGDRMSDIRSVIMPKTIDGKVYPLTVNYNVIADIQAELGGLRELLKPSNYLKVASVALAAMLNEAAYQMKRPGTLPKGAPKKTELRRTAGAENRFCAGARGLADAVQRHGGELLARALSAPPERSMQGAAAAAALPAAPEPR